MFGWKGIAWFIRGLLILLLTLLMLSCKLWGTKLLVFLDWRRFFIFWSSVTELSLFFTSCLGSCCWRYSLTLPCSHCPYICLRRAHMTYDYWYIIYADYLSLTPKAMMIILSLFLLIMSMEQLLDAPWYRSLIWRCLLEVSSDPSWLWFCYGLCYAKIVQPLGKDESSLSLTLWCWTAHGKDESYLSLIILSLLLSLLAWKEDEVGFFWPLLLFF